MTSRSKSIVTKSQALVNLIEPVVSAIDLRDSSATAKRSVRAAKEEIDEARKEMQSLLETRRDEMAKVKQMAPEMAAPEFSDNPAEQQATLLDYRVRSYRAEIAAANERASAVELPLPHQVMLGQIHENTQRLVQELRECIAYQQKEVEERKAEILRAQQLRAEQLQLQAGLEALASQGSQNTDEEQAAKIKAIQASNASMVKQLGDFIDATFPDPEPIAPKGRRKGAEPQELLSLKSLLQTLMNRIIQSPQDPYIVLQPEHWPAYVELLQRAGIAVKHAQDSTRLKLTDFHK